MSRRIAALLLFSFVSLTLSAETLRNSDIIKMVKAGIGASTIEEKIRASDAEFKTDTDSLIILKDAKVPDSVIKAMIAKESRDGSSSKSSQAETRRIEIPTREFDVYLETSNWNTCPGTLTIDSSGMHGTGCAKRNLNFDVKWKDIKSFCYEFAFYQTMYVETAKKTYRISSNDGKGVYRIQEMLRKYRESIPERSECKSND